MLAKVNQRIINTFWCRNITSANNSNDLMFGEGPRKAEFNT